MRCVLSCPEQLAEPRAPEIQAEPDQEPEDDVEVDGFPDAQVSDDGAAHISGEEDRSQYGGLRDEIDHDAKQLDDAQRSDQGLGQTQVAHSLDYVGDHDELHHRAEGKSKSDENRHGASCPNRFPVALVHLASAFSRSSVGPPARSLPRETGANHGVTTARASCSAVAPCRSIRRVVAAREEGSPIDTRSRSRPSGSGSVNVTLRSESSRAVEVSLGRDSSSTRRDSCGQRSFVSFRVANAAWAWSFRWPRPCSIQSFSHVPRSSLAQPAGVGTLANGASMRPASAYPTRRTSRRSRSMRQDSSARVGLARSDGIDAVGKVEVVENVAPAVAGSLPHPARRMESPAAVRRRGDLERQPFARGVLRMQHELQLQRLAGPDPDAGELDAGALVAGWQLRVELTQFRSLSSRPREMSRWSVLGAGGG